jgi:predicted phage terminase large subunit-like protein
VGGKTILSVDCNFKDKKDSDRVAIGALIALGGKYYLLDYASGPWGFIRTQNEIARMCDVHNPAAVWVEDKANGPAIVQTLKSAIPQIKEWTPTGSKEARAEAVSPLVETGCVVLPESAPWLEAFLKEVCSFPKAKNDDAVDMLSQGLLILHKPGNIRYREALEKARREMR